MACPRACSEWSGRQRHVRSRGANAECAVPLLPKVTQEEEYALSALRHLDLVHCPIMIAYGDKESPEFQRQGRDFAAALKQNPQAKHVGVRGSRRARPGGHALRK